MTSTSNKHQNDSPNKILLLGRNSTFSTEFISIAATYGFDSRHAKSLLSLGSFAGLQDFDLVIVEFDLPTVKGFEVAQYVETFFPRIPVIVLFLKQSQTTELLKHDSLSSMALLGNSDRSSVIPSKIDTRKATTNPTKMPTQAVGATLVKRSVTRPEPSYPKCVRATLGYETTPKILLENCVRVLNSESRDFVTPTPSSRSPKDAPPRV